MAPLALLATAAPTAPSSARPRYGPFGTRRARAGDISVPFGFTGEFTEPGGADPHGPVRQPLRLRPEPPHGVHRPPGVVLHDGPQPPRLLPGYGGDLRDRPGRRRERRESRAGRDGGGTGIGRPDERCRKRCGRCRQGGWRHRQEIGAAIVLAGRTRSWPSSRFSGGGHPTRPEPSSGAMTTPSVDMLVV